MSKYLMCLLVLAGSLTALPVHAGAKQPNDSPLASILTDINVRDRSVTRTIAEKLAGWSKPLSKADIEAVKDFADKRKQDDWQLHILSERLLRKNNLVPPVSETIRQAEDILLPLMVTKGYNTKCDKEVNQMVALGPDVISVLHDVLSYPFEENRKIVAIRALVRFGDPKSVSVLKSNIADRDYLMVAESVSGLLSLKGDKAAMDEMAAMFVKLDDNHQEWSVRIVSKATIPLTSKMRFYSHYDEFSPSGKAAIIRSLGPIPSQASFDQLSNILLKERNGLAAEQLTDMIGFDPCPVFVSAFKAGQSDPGLIVGAAVRNCYEAIPYLEEIKAGKAVGTSKTLPVLAAGALSKLGKDPRKNTDIVLSALREPKPDYYTYQAAGLINDDKVTQLLIDQLKVAASSKEDSSVAGNIIQALGSSSNKTAVKMLMDEVDSLPLTLWDYVGNALIQLGTSIGDGSVKADGEGIKGTTYYAGMEHWAGIPDPDSPEIAKAKADATEFLKRNPKLFIKLFGEDLRGRSSAHKPFVLKLATASWTPKATPVFEEMIKTDKHIIKVYHQDKTFTDHYRIREELAKLLTEKTGKTYTYVDCDGKTKNPNDSL